MSINGHAQPWERPVPGRVRQKGQRLFVANPPKKFLERKGVQIQEINFANGKVVLPQMKAQQRSRTANGQFRFLSAKYFNDVNARGACWISSKMKRSFSASTGGVFKTKRISWIIRDG
jgi:hypothetical protein